MKVLVTGGCGFIGSNIAEALADEYEVVVLDNMFLGSISNISAVKDRVKIVKGDILDAELVNKTADVDFILHEAAASSSPMFKQDLGGSFAVNINGFINVLNAAKENSVKRVIFASTSSIYGNTPGCLKEDMSVSPPNFYAVTKLCDENLARIYSQEYGIETVGLRYMSIYGPHECSKGIYANLVSQFLWDIKKGKKPVIYGNGKQTRDFTYVKDAVHANILAMEARKKFLGEIFNIGTGNSVSLNEMVGILNKVLGKEIEPEYIENPVKNYIMMQKADLSKARRILDYEPRFTLEQGIRDMVSSS